MTHKLHTDASNALHIRVNNIQGRENQAETPEKWGKRDGEFSLKGFYFFP